MRIQGSITIALVLFGCTSTKNDCQDLRLITNLEIPINNDDPSSFSFIEYENDETSTARSIALSHDGNYAFLVDNGHTNVKKVNLANGITIVSEQLSKLSGYNLSLFDIGTTEKNVYLTTNRGIAVLSHDLDYIGIELSPSQLPSFTEFLNVSNDSVSVVYEHRQRTDRSVDQKIFTLVNLIPKTSTRNIPIHEYSVSTLHRSGIAYTITNIDQRCEIRTPIGCFRVGRNIDLLGEYFEGRNVDFTPKQFVFFDVTPGAVTIYNYEANSD